MVSEDDHAVYRTHWRVRVYELDANGHVNNAVYLNYAEQVAIEHAEALGVGRGWTAQHNATWVVRRHEILFRHPAAYGDDLELTTRLESLKGASGVRRTTIIRASDRQSIAEVTTQWVWVRLSDNRPTRLPRQARAVFQMLEASQES
ncbi:MAG: acyl-CoA thioesterase [Chloroflexota bacterium]|nr:acyl-CoA thioesterase [Chloroflexota bacterium]